MSPTVAIVDIDGVLADATHREHHLAGRPKDWAAFFAEVGADAPMPSGIGRVEALATDYGVVLLTGRPESCRATTLEWLGRHQVPFAELIMRPEGDHRPAHLLKADLVGGRWSPVEVSVILDDDPRVIEALQHRGYPAELAGGSSQA